MASAGRLTREQLVSQNAITAALQAADAHRADPRRYLACIVYASRVVDVTRGSIELVDRKTNRAWRD